MTLYGPTNMAEVIARVNSIMRCAALHRQDSNPQLPIQTKHRCEQWGAKLWRGALHAMGNGSRGA